MADIERKSMLLEVVRSVLAERPSEPRVARKNRWMADPNRKMAAREREVFHRLPDEVPSITVTDDKTDLDESEVKALIQETLDIKEAQDVLDGRYGAIRSIVFRAMDTRYGEHQPGEIRGDGLGYKFVRQVSESLSADWDTLRERIGEDLWEQVTVPVRQVDEALLVQAVEDGRIPRETLAEVVTLSRRESLYLRRVDEEE